MCVNRTKFATFGPNSCKLSLILAKLIHELRTHSHAKNTLRGSGCNYSEVKSAANDALSYVLYYVPTPSLYPLLCPLLYLMSTSMSPPMPPPMSYACPSLCCLLCPNYAFFYAPILLTCMPSYALPYAIYVPTYVVGVSRGYTDHHQGRGHP